MDFGDCLCLEDDRRCEETIVVAKKTIIFAIETIFFVIQKMRSTTDRTVVETNTTVSEAETIVYGSNLVSFVRKTVVIGAAMMRIAVDEGTENSNGRCSSASLTRPFRNTLN